MIISNENFKACPTCGKKPVIHKYRYTGVNGPELFSAECLNCMEFIGGITSLEKLEHDWNEYHIINKQKEADWLKAEAEKKRKRKPRKTKEEKELEKKQQEDEINEKLARIRAAFDSQDNEQEEEEENYEE